METACAYLDNYKEIRIEIAKYFYDGESKTFYVSLENGALKELSVLRKSREEDRVVYTVRVFSSLQIGTAYEIVEEHGYRFPLQYRYIVRDGRFDREYSYHEEDLGVTYREDHTLFKVWAPTVSTMILCLGNEYYPMKRGEKGVYWIDVMQDTALCEYHYLAYVNGKWTESVDPYAKGSTINSKRSVVIPPKSVQVARNTPQVDSEVPVIYEVSVRDFTSSLRNTHRSTFKGFISEDLRTNNKQLAGFDYLKSLGITHVQFMPIYDFYTVDEEYKFKFYNWGYDPIQYNIPEGSYSSDPLDPLARIIECKQMIEACHKENMYVVMDVVYNHMYNKDLSSFEKLVPYYYFRMNTKGEYSNGSFCGNDFDSTREMARAYIVNSVKMWMGEYNVDGFRFDLMGILDIDTMKEITRQCRAMKPNCLIYGEGWNMPTMLEEQRRSSMMNAYQLSQVNFFNDSFRDIVKGKTSEGESGVRGYLTGDISYIEEMKRVLLGNTSSQLFTSPMQSINYVECHDNATAYDKVRMCLYYEGEENWKKRCKLLISAVLLAQGIPFLHAGQEFLRTKNMAHNTYNSSDSINTLDYERKDRYLDVVEFTRAMIKFRKNTVGFTKREYHDIERDIQCLDMGNGILAYRVVAEDQVYTTYFNPTEGSYQLPHYDQCILSSDGIWDNYLPPISMCITMSNR